MLQNRASLTFQNFPSPWSLAWQQGGTYTSGPGTTMTWVCATLEAAVATSHIISGPSRKSWRKSAASSHLAVASMKSGVKALKCTRNPGCELVPTGAIGQTSSHPPDDPIPTHIPNLTTGARLLATLS